MPFAKGQCMCSPDELSMQPLSLELQAAGQGPYGIMIA